MLAKFAKGVLSNSSTLLYCRAFHIRCYFDGVVVVLVHPLSSKVGLGVPWHHRELLLHKVSNKLGPLDYGSFMPLMFWMAFRLPLLLEIHSSAEEDLLYGHHLMVPNLFFVARAAAEKETSWRTTAAASRFYRDLLQESFFAAVRSSQCVLACWLNVNHDDVGNIDYYKNDEQSFVGSLTAAVNKFTFAAHA